MTKSTNIFLGSLMASLIANTSPTFACGGLFSSCMKGAADAVHEITTVSQPLLIGELMAVLADLSDDGKLNLSNKTAYIASFSKAFDSLTPPDTAKDAASTAKRTAVSLLRTAFSDFLDDGKITSRRDYVRVIQENILKLDIPAPKTPTECAEKILLKSLEAILNDVNSDGKLDGKGGGYISVIRSLLDTLEPAEDDFSVAALTRKGLLMAARTKLKDLKDIMGDTTPVGAGTGVRVSAGIAIRPEDVTLDSKRDE